MSENNNEEIKDNLDQEEILNEQAGQEEESEDNAQEEVKEVSPEDKFNELNNKYVRLYSDFDNFRKRTIKEKADIISTANAGLMSDLIGVLDDFERAINNNEKVDDAESLKEGFKLIHNKFASLLKNKGLEPMDAKGQVFNTDIHEAITNIPVTDDKDKGKVVDVIQKGYNLRGKMLRYAKVVVGQ